MCSVKIFDYKTNADLNKNVFNLDLQIAKEGLSRISKGKFFHSWSLSRHILGKLYSLNLPLNIIFRK